MKNRIQKIKNEIDRSKILISQLNNDSHIFDKRDFLVAKTTYLELALQGIDLICRGIDPEEKHKTNFQLLEFDKFKES